VDGLRKGWGNLDETLSLQILVGLSVVHIPLAVFELFLHFFLEPALLPILYIHISSFQTRKEMGKKRQEQNRKIGGKGGGE
jgi:hypothetical protein